MQVWFYGENGTDLGNQAVKLEETTGGYVYLEKKGIVPAGAVVAEVEVHLLANQSNGSGTLYVDSLKFEYGVVETEATVEEIPVPEALQVLGLGGDEIKLSWTVSDPSQLVASYQVRSNQSVVASVYEPQWTMTAVEGTTYNFTVVSVNEHGQVSDESESVVYTHDKIPPTVPTILTAIRLSSTEAELTWTASEDSSGIKEYEVWVNGVLYQTLNTTSLMITGLEAGISYEVRIRARDNSGNDSWSEFITIAQN